MSLSLPKELDYGIGDDDVESHIQYDGNISISNNFVDSTYKTFPRENFKLLSTLPFTVLIKPFLKDYEVQTLSSGSIIRCVKCGAYVNPFFRFERGYFTCNICGESDQVPEVYSNRVAEFHKKNMIPPELSWGVVDFLAPVEYTDGPPQPPCYLFLLDFSNPQWSEVIFKSLSEFILNNLENIVKLGNGRTRVGFITFDSCLQFYSFNPLLKKAKILVVSELEEVFIPVDKSSLLVNLEESMDHVKDFLKVLRNNGIVDNKTTRKPSCLGTALNASGDLLSNYGGKLVVFCSTHPEIGPLSFSTKDYDFEDAKFIDRRNMFLSLAKIFSRDRISVDFHFFSGTREKKKIGLQSLSILSRCCGGKVYYYDINQLGLLDGLVGTRLSHLFSSNVGFESVMRLRASNRSNIFTKNYFGSFFVRENSLLDFPVLSQDMSIGVEIGFIKTEKTENWNCITDSKHVFVQAGIIYTSSFGVRKIRCINYVFPVVNNIEEFVKSVNFGICFSVLGKIVCRDLLNNGFTTRRNLLEVSLLRKVVTIGKLLNRIGVPHDKFSSFIGLLFCLFKSSVFADTIHPKKIAFCSSYLSSSFNYCALMVLPKLYMVQSSVDSETFKKSVKFCRWDDYSSCGIYILETEDIGILFCNEAKYDKELELLINRQFFRTFRKHLTMCGSGEDFKYEFRLHYDKKKIEDEYFSFVRRIMSSLC